MSAGPLSFHHNKTFTSNNNMLQISATTLVFTLETYWRGHITILLPFVQSRCEYFYRNTANILEQMKTLAKVKVIVN